MRTWITGLLVAAALSPAAVRAADDPKPAAPQGTYAVIIGVTETSDNTIIPRESAETDAKALYDLLKDPKYFDAAADRVKLIVGKEATREACLKAVREAVAKTGKDDLLVIAFFGRGSSAGDATCLFGADCKFEDRSKTGILGSDLQAELKGAKDQKIAMFLDIHFKGFTPGKDPIVEPTLTDISKAITGGEEKEDAPPQDKLLVFGNLPDNDPIMVGKNSLFTATLIEALKGAADSEGYEADGLVTVDELAKYLDKNIPEQARKLGKTAKEKESLPIIAGAGVSHFPITRNPKLTEAVAKRVKALEELEVNGKIGKDELAEGKKLLTRMPKLKTPQELRRKYQALVDGTLKADDFSAARKELKASLVLDKAAGDKFADNVAQVAAKVEARYVKKVVLGDLAAAAVRGLYRRVEEPVPADVEKALKNAKTWSAEEAKTVLADARVLLGKREDLADNKDANLAIATMLGSLNDPYTTFYDQDTLKKIESQFRGAFSGVGLQFRKDFVRDAFVVTTPIKNSPAFKAGIQAGDFIVAIKRESDPNGDPLKDGDPKEFTTKGMKNNQFLDIVLGKPGVPITLVVERDGKEKEYTINRGRVQVETVLGVKRDEKADWSYWIDEKAKIGYIHLTQFSPGSYRDIAAVMKELADGGMKGFVFDLRFNPGGVLGGNPARGNIGVIEICKLFITGGKVVSVRPRVGGEDVYRAERPGPYTDFPMAVLVNGNSASASEIFAACVQDHERAVVVGERSYGKGSVQSLDDRLDVGGEIKFTTARYFPPSDKNIDKLSSGGKDTDEWGVLPDKGYEVKLTREQTKDAEEWFRDHEIIRPKGAPGPKKFEDKQLEEALKYVRKKLEAKK